MEEVTRITRVTTVREGVPKKLLLRRWLNRRGHHSTAFVYANLSCHEYVRDEDEDGIVQRDRELNGELCFADCTRQITLEIQADDNTLDKLNKLIAAIEEVRDYVARGMEWMDG